MQSALLADTTPKLGVRNSPALREIETKFLKNTCSDQHEQFRAKIQLLRQSPTPNKFRVKKNSKSTARHRYQQQQDVPFGSSISAQFQPSRNTSSALNHYNSESMKMQLTPGLTRPTQHPEQRVLPSVRIKRPGISLEGMTPLIDQPKFTMNHVSIVNKSNLFLIPYLKNKLRELNSDTNCAHIADIPVVQSLSNFNTRKAATTAIRPHKKAKDRHQRHTSKLRAEEALGPW